MAILSKNTFTYRAEQIHAFPLAQQELIRSGRCIAFTQHNLKKSYLKKVLHIEKFSLKLKHSRHTVKSAYHQIFTINLPNGYSHFLNISRFETYKIQAYHNTTVKIGFVGNSEQKLTVRKILKNMQRQLYIF
jgi:hypothetical protein